MSKCQIDFSSLLVNQCGMGEIHQLILRDGLEATKGKADLVCVKAAHEVLSDELYEIGIAHAGFAMAALPHRKVKETVWKRQGGNIKLLIESGLDQDENPVGIPYGSIARMILLYLQTQAVRTQRREIELGSSMNRWLEAMNIKAGGRTYKSVKEQAHKISRCRLTFFHTNEGSQVVSNGAFVRDAIFPLAEDNTAQGALWREVVRLDEAFYESLIHHPLPLREVAIRNLSHSSKAIDVYIWLAYRLHSLQKDQKITWAALKAQFGADYSQIRFFKRDFVAPLKLALSVYPEANVTVEDEGVILHPSLPPVAKKYVSIG